jgi:hypothetical protein
MIDKIPSITNKYISIRKIKIFEDKLNNYELKLGKEFYEKNRTYDEYYNDAFNIYFKKELELIRNDMREYIENNNLI